MPHQDVVAANHHTWGVNTGNRRIQMSDKVQSRIDGGMGVGFTSIFGPLLSCTMLHGCGQPFLCPRLPVHNRWSTLLVLPLCHVVVVLHEDLQGQQNSI